MASYVLTNGIDNVTGTAEDDVLDGGPGAWNPGDILDGGEGAGDQIFLQPGPGPSTYDFSKVTMTNWEVQNASSAQFGTFVFSVGQLAQFQTLLFSNLFQSGVLKFVDSGTVDLAGPSVSGRISSIVGMGGALTIKIDPSLFGNWDTNFTGTGGGSDTVELVGPDNASYSLENVTFGGNKWNLKGSSGNDIVLLGAN